MTTRDLCSACGAPLTAEDCPLYGDGPSHAPFVHLWVVSFVWWNGDVQGGGGFLWLPEGTTEAAALDMFRNEVSDQRGEAARVRLIRCPVPRTVLDAPQGEGEISEVTLWIDESTALDWIETDLPSHRVWFQTG